MLPKIVFATHNAHKTKEVRQMLAGKYEVLDLHDIGCHEDIPETGNTFQENALLKARHVLQHYHLPCIADDSGLEVDALNSAPGVYSARYAGPQKSDSDNMQKLLQELQHAENRAARFKCCIAYSHPLGDHFFEGTIEGQIAHTPKGNNGFGYDPVFVPDGHDRTFAEMSAEEKATMSHRGRAITALLNFLE